MYVETVPNRNSKPAILLREGWRQDGKVKKRTLANLSHWPSEKIEALRRVLRGEALASPNDLFRVTETVPHGDVEAVLGTVNKLGLDRLIASKRSRPRDLVVAMIVERLLHPGSKLAMSRTWHASTLTQELSLVDAEIDELYEALDWLAERQARIEKKLAQRHLSEGSLVLYDVSRSSYEGRTCPLAQFGYEGAEKKGRRLIVYGVLTDREGRPIAIEIYPGRTGDPTTVPDQVERLRESFGLERVVLVGDRGLLTNTQIDHLREHPGLGWISSLRSPAVRRLFDEGSVQRSLFDETNLAEISSPDYPDERLVVCFNPVLADERQRKRQELLEATEKELERVARDVARRTRKPYSESEIGAKVGRVLHRFKMAKHFDWRVEEGKLLFSRSEDSIRRESELDGIYVVRTSEGAETLTAEDTVRSYKSLARVEQAFRTLKGFDLLVRPIFHRKQQRVRAHFFLCLLAYYVEWHMRKAWATLLFEDEQLEQDRKRRDPVAPAQPSDLVKKKKARKKTSDGLPVHSFRTLLEVLANRSRNTCSVNSKGLAGVTFQQLTDPTPIQERALQLLGLL